ncbi:SMP-30/gluconolactonase/LRE family protein, partial [Nonomuraea sp. RK-328]|nr:SMP-30/gluconolactonase/LRE family protein [Nonomuraea sp. RK-328]
LAIDITVAVPGTARVGEGPFWDPDTSELTWVDILGGAIHTTGPTRPDPRTIIMPTLVGAAVPKRSGGFVAATVEGFTDIRRDGSWIIPHTVLPPGRRVLARFPSGGGAPDGMAIDAEGCLWIAMWGGGRLVRLDPEGRLLSEVPVPVAQPSSCAFGGPDLDVLYVTTAREGLGPHPVGPAGSVLAVRGLGVQGMPTARFGG